jgi:hypothetical protein
MTNKAERLPLLQGTLDLIVMRALATMGAQHSYALAARLTLTDTSRWFAGPVTRRSSGGWSAMRKRQWRDCQNETR